MGNFFKFFSSRFRIRIRYTDNKHSSCRGFKLTINSMNYDNSIILIMKGINVNSYSKTTQISHCNGRNG